jgi:hypothetical protein
MISTTVTRLEALTAEGVALAVARYSGGFLAMLSHRNRYVTRWHAEEEKAIGYAVDAWDQGWFEAEVTPEALDAFRAERAAARAASSRRTRRNRKTTEATLTCLGLTSEQASDLVTAAVARGLSTTHVTKTLERWGFVATYAIAVEHNPGNTYPYTVAEWRVHAEPIEKAS